MTDPNFTIETPRLHLIYPRPELDLHCDFIVRLYNTPEFISSGGGKPTQYTTRDAARKYIQDRFVCEHQRHGYGTYMIVLKPEQLSPQLHSNTMKDTNNRDPSASHDSLASRGQQDDERGAGTLVGTISLSNGATPEVSYAAPDLGFAVLPQYCRRGIATEASLGVMKYAAEENGVHVFLGLHDPSNQASAGIFRKLGFSWHGKRVLKIVGGAIGMVWAGRIQADGKTFIGLNEEEVRSLGLPKEAGDS